MAGEKLIQKALGILAGSAPSKVVTDPAERAANLAKAMSRSAIKNTETNEPLRLYHATTQPNLEALKAGGNDPTLSGPATWLSPYPDKQPAWHNVGGGSGYREGTNVMPVYADIQTPLVMDTPEMIDWAQTVFAGGSREFPQYMLPEWRKGLIDEGYDGIVYGGPKSKEYALHDLQIGQQPHRDEEILSLFPERQLKSAIGNSGEYNMEVPRLSEARGGEVEDALHAVRHHLAGGGFLSDLFSGPDYLSTGEVASFANMPTQDETNADFFKADRALRLAREAQAPEAPLTAPRPGPVQSRELAPPTVAAPPPTPVADVTIPFAAPESGVSMLSSDISPASVTSLPLAYTAAPAPAPASAAIDQATGKMTARIPDEPHGTALTKQQADYVIRTIAAETSGKSPEETQAIASVILNRINSGKYGSSPEAVLFAKRQFEPWMNPAGANYPMKISPKSQRYSDARDALEAAMAGEDITRGATNFWGPKSQYSLGREAPSWGRTGGVDIGETRFHNLSGEARPAGAVQMAQAQEVPSTGLFAFGTNDPNPQTALKSAQQIYENARRAGIDPVFVLPNSADPRFAPISEALKKYADERGIKYETPGYDPKDPLHITPDTAKEIAKKYPGALVGGDSNSWRLQKYGYGRPVSSPNAFVDKGTGVKLGQVGAGSPDVAKWFGQYVDRLSRGRAHGGLVDDALHVVREHHADGEAVGQAPVATDNFERVRAAESAANLARQIQAYEASMASIRQQPQDIQSMTHAPEKPRAPISVEALGKNREFGSAPYDVAGPLSSFAQGAYDMKTLPLYMYPPTAPLGMAIDTAEGVASGSPTQVAMGALGGPLKVARNVIAPLAVATGVTAPDEAEAGSLERALRMIRAYHGSPHKFDRFDLSKIGTGEGAQAYGHGLYFAGNEDVAKYYRDVLTQRDPTGYANAHYNAQQQVARFGNDPERAAEIFRDQLNAVNPNDPNFEKFRSTLEMIESGKYKEPLNQTGHMYEVNINANPEHFLDWDMPFAGQSKTAQDAIKYAFGPQPGMATFGSRTIDIPREVHTRLLLEKGIPGIKYADAGSRSFTSNPTHNYVIFDDKLIDINRRYAQGGDVEPAYNPAERTWSDAGSTEGERLTRDENTYGPANIEERRARIQELTAPTNYPGDKLEAPQGYMTPATAVEWKSGDAGPYAVDASGATLPLIPQPGMLPMYRDPTIDSIRPAMPGFLDLAGNVVGAPAGITAMRTARAVMAGERPAANVVSAMGDVPSSAKSSVGSTIFEDARQMPKKDFVEKYRMEIEDPRTASHQDFKDMEQKHKTSQPHYKYDPKQLDPFELDSWDEALNEFSLKHVQELQNAIKNKADIPPILVEGSHLDKKYRPMVVDGHHRTIANLRENVSEVPLFFTNKTLKQIWDHFNQQNRAKGGSVVDRALMLVSRQA